MTTTDIATTYIIPPAASLVPDVLFTPENVENLIASIEKHVLSIVVDGTTPEGRKDLTSLAYKVSQSKVHLDTIGKDYVADLKKKPGQIDAQRKIMRDRLDALRDKVRKPVDDYEAAEREAEAKKLREIEEARKQREAEERAEFERQQAEVQRQQAEVQRRADELAERERKLAEHEAAVTMRDEITRATDALTGVPGDVMAMPITVGVLPAERRAFVENLKSGIDAAIDAKREAEYADDFAEDEAAEGICAQPVSHAEVISTSMPSAPITVGEGVAEYERKRAINRAVHAALMEHGELTDSGAKRILYCIIHGYIPNTTINY